MNPNLTNTNAGHYPSRGRLLEEERSQSLFGTTVFPHAILSRFPPSGAWFLCGLLTICTASGGTLFVWPDSPGPAPPYADWATAARTIQEAVDAASTGDTVLVTNGVYATGGRAVLGTATRVVVDRPIRVRSVNGPNVTTIDGAPGRCAYVGTNAVLNGFSLIHGSLQVTNDQERQGGGAWCEPPGMLTNCVLAGNSAKYGGGVYGGVLYNCTLTNNSATYGGGANNCTLHECTLIGNGAYLSGGGADSCTLSNCSLTDNSAWSSDGNGGGVSFCDLNHCTLTGNYAGEEGGGARDSALNDCTLIGNGSYDGGGTDQCTLTRCIIIGNTASTQGGPYGGTGGGVRYSTLDECIVVGNTAGYNAGADYCNLANCTVVANAATSSAGGVGGAYLTNCIVYCNTAPTGPNYWEFCAFSYCCTTPMPTNGVGNITNAPLFLDYAGGNLRLQSNSPCINSGNNAYAASTIDLDDNPRIVSCTVDIGAYECQGPGSVISYAWLQQFALPTDGSADFADFDTDRMNNWQERIADTDPTNAQSLFRIEAIAHGPPVMVRFPSSSNRLYTLLYSPDTAEPNAIGVTWTKVPGHTDCPGTGGAFSLSDSSSTAPRFYRVGVRRP